MAASDIPHLSKSELVDSSNLSQYRGAVRLAEGGKVRATRWAAPHLSGEVDDGEVRHPTIDFTSTVFIRGNCECGEVKGRLLCRHAIALYLAAAAQRADATVGASAQPSAKPLKKSSRHQGGRLERASNESPMKLDGAIEWLAAQLPSRESVHYDPCKNILKAEAFQLDPRTARWFLRGRHKVLSFLAKHWRSLLRAQAVAAGTGLQQLLAKVVFPELKCETEATDGGFMLRAGFVISAGGVDASGLIGSALQQGRLYSEDGDQVVLVDPGDIERMASLQAKISGGATGHLAHQLVKNIAREEIPYIDGVMDSIGPDWKADGEWCRLTEPLKSLGALQPAPVEAGLDAQLRTYQRLGVAWMWHLYGLGLGGILADEMGLGKTVQAVALIDCVLTAEKGRQSADAEDLSTQLRRATPMAALVVCPAGLIENWCREIRRFAPHLEIRVHHGARRIDPAAAVISGGVVVTSYSTLAVDQALFSGSRWAVVVGDEAQHIKNRRTRSAAVLRQLRANGRFLLTGTPVENRIEDLASLFEFLLPGYLVTAEDSGTNSGRRWSNEAVQERAAPYILRRTKSIVAPELPEKLEQTVYCQMEPKQQVLYRDYLERSGRAILDLELGGANEGRVRMEVLKQILRLRQICADPRLVEPDCLAEDSSKWIALRELLNEARDGDHRVLVFSQFVQLLKRVRADLEEAGWSCAYLDGSVRNRMAEVDRFQNDASVDVFLISLRAGGTGLNLTAADTVVHLDPWWNPAVEAQATDRAHRIGQTQKVTSLKLIVADSIEERILDLQNRKSALLDEIFEAGEAATGNLSLDDLKGLLG